MADSVAVCPTVCEWLPVADQVRVGRRVGVQLALHARVGRAVGVRVVLHVPVHEREDCVPLPAEAVAHAVGEGEPELLKDMEMLAVTLRVGGEGVCVAGEGVPFALGVQVPLWLRVAVRLCVPVGTRMGVKL